MKQETGRRIARWGYMAVAAGYLWWNLARMTEFSWTFTIMPYLGDFGIIAAILSLILGWEKRSPLVWTMTAGLGWMLLMSAIRGESVLAAEWQYLKEGIIAFLVLAPLPGCLTENRFRQFLKGTIAVWTTAITCQAAIGLWAAISGHAVFSMKGTWYIGMNLGDHRLYLNAYVTTAAAKMGMTVLLTAILFALSRTKRAKIACVMAILVQCGALALTDCRTAFVALGVAAGFCVWTLLGAKVHMPSKLNHRLMLPMLMAAGIILCYGLLTGVLTLLAPSVAPGPLDNVNLLEFPAHLMTEASAEQKVILDSTPVHRSIDTTDTFNGRWGIWKGALRLLKAQPELLLTGTSAPLAAGMMNLYTDPGTKYFQHAHNLYLQTLVSWGIPGLLILLAVIAMFLVQTARISKRNQPLWVLMLPLPVIYLLVCELVDCFTMLSTGSPMLYWLCLLMGAVDAQARRLKPQALPK